MCGGVVEFHVAIISEGCNVVNDISRIMEIWQPPLIKAGPTDVPADATTEHER
jgi:hypothetical protein